MRHGSKLVLILFGNHQALRNMPSIALIKTAFREWVTRERSPRLPEPDLIMDDPEQVASYVRAGLEDGVMAPVYLFHCANICEVIRPGDTVLDLACGPANQLAMAARLNPATHFIGVDLSEPMLQQAGERVAQQQLRNVSLRHGDITTLTEFPNASVDAVISTMALHHLPDEHALKRAFAEVARVLKPGGGVYLADFGHLKAERSILYFAYQYQDRQPELFTRDYLNSLRAAFALQDFRQVAGPLVQHARLYSTFIMPYMVAIKSPARQPGNLALTIQLKKLREALPVWHQADFRHLSAIFRLGGLDCSLMR